MNVFQEYYVIGRYYKEIVTSQVECDKMRMVRLMCFKARKGKISYIWGMVEVTSIKDNIVKNRIAWFRCA